MVVLQHLGANAVLQLLYSARNDKPFCQLTTINLFMALLVTSTADDIVGSFLLVFFVGGFRFATGALTRTIV